MEQWDGLGKILQDLLISVIQMYWGVIQLHIQVLPPLYLTKYTENHGAVPDVLLEEDDAH